MGYMPRPQTVGETTPCPECASKGITVIIKAVESEYLGNKRLSWKNPDGSGHIKTNGTDEKGKPIFVHNPPTSAEQSTILPDLKEKIDACEKTLGDDTDQFAIFYMALRNKFNDYVTQVAKTTSTKNYFGGFLKILTKIIDLILEINIF